MKVTGVQDEIRGSIKAMIRGPVLAMLEEYGFERPDRLEFTYDVQRQAIVMGMRYGNATVLLHMFDESSARYVNPDVLTTIAEALAQDARIPIAQDL